MHHFGACVRVQFGDARQNRARLVVRRGAELVDEEAALIEPDEVGEGATRVDSYAGGLLI